MYEYEQAAYQQGISSVCGVDEAGRGPLAGDVYAAAVILPQGVKIEGIDDSKKLSEKKREKLYDEITRTALYYCIATATVEEIDRLNILQASMLAMRRAVAGLAVQPALVLVDGNCDPKFPTGISCKTIVGGDGKSASIAAASILAKVARDRYMKELDAKYPAYRFAQHKGYGTKLHYEMLEAHGVSPVHRRTFLKKLQQKERVNGTDA